MAKPAVIYMRISLLRTNLISAARIIYYITKACIKSPRYQRCLIGEGSPDCSKYESLRATYIILLKNPEPERASVCNFGSRLGEKSHIIGAVIAIIPSVGGKFFLRALVNTPSNA